MKIEPEYPLQTERLLLRPFTRGDVDAVYSYRRREDVARYLHDPPLSREECALAVQQRVTQVKFESAGDRVVLAVELRDTAIVIGEVSLIWRNVEARQGEIGWIFDPAYHGVGYATESASRIMDVAFQSLDLHRVFARCSARNTGSWRLMERLGMRREAHFHEHEWFKGEWDEEFVYAILQREWVPVAAQEASGSVLK